ncbi:insulinase family protein [bacterium]|nr:MAG: insulinase family protein [bacterium]
MRSTPRSWTVLASWSLSLVLIFLAAAPAQALDSSNVEEVTLSNGVRVLLWPDDTIPNLAVYTFWKVGSRNEAPGITGLAHFFEHMMFNGSEHFPPGEFDRTMEAAGGSNNAYTSANVTVYQDWVPASALEITLDLEADRIRALSVDPELVESERGVVMSERRRSVEDDNHSLMWEQLMSSAYMAHPYQWPVIGWRSDIENWRQQDVEDFHRTWYAVNNALFVICGAYDRDELIGLLEEKIGSIEAREVGRDVVTVEPEQRGERRVELRKEAQMGSVLVGWHVPETAHEDIRVLELADLILSSGESSRLYRRLVDQDQIALWAWGDTDNNFDPGLYQMLVQSREGVDGTTIEAALYEEIDRMKNEPVTDDELQKAKNMLVAGFYRDMATISGRANQLGSFEIFHGDWRKLFDVVGTYESIQAEDIQRVLSTWLTAQNRTVVTLIPTQDTEAGNAR